MYNEESTLAKKVIWDLKEIIWYKSESEYVLHHHDKSKKIDSWRVYFMGRNRALEYYKYNYRSKVIWSIIFELFKLYCKVTNIYGDYNTYRKGIDDAKTMIKNNLNENDILNGAKKYFAANYKK